jgi:hypothetical protein
MGITVGITLEVPRSEAAVMAGVFEPFSVAKLATIQIDN